MLSGENGILRQAASAKTETEEATELEKVKLAVASAILNRCENAEYQQLHGIDPIAQITAANQFEGYTTGEFQQYMGNNSDVVIEAVKAALAGVRNHTQCTLN